MERLTQKFETAIDLMPAPHIQINAKTGNLGAIFYGTTTNAANEAIEQLGAKGIVLNSMRVRAFPFKDEVRKFINRHDQVFVIEQNRDGQMRTVATGANMANNDLLYIGVSGDGDTASIGMGQFIHIIRRNVNMVYIVMNNGCYGLTKGQDSATADKGSSSRKGRPNPFEAIDLCETAVQMGAGFVARGFSGDKEQLVPLLKAAMGHRGFALVDVISPCVTFNNTPASTKSYHWARDHMEATATFDFIPFRQEITTDYEEGATQNVTLHDGSVIRLHKTDNSFDVT